MSTMTLIKALQTPALYDHDVEDFKLLETHISWVILTGDYVYKIKKPFDMGFLDFSTLDKRQFFCEEEIRLNKLLAPHIYLDVVKITGSEDSPVINGEGEAIEYAVRMREFPQTSLFDRLLAKGELSGDLIIKVAKAIARFHDDTAVCAADSYFGTVQQIHEPVIQNFEQVADFLSDPEDIEELKHIDDWANGLYERLKPVFEQRKTHGFIRECHGDAHLGNIALIGEEAVFFDCLEFNDSLRWTDVMADLAFLAMDLEDRGRWDLSHILVNQYIYETGDYQGLQVLDYYKSYRALVRAKVNLFQRAQVTDDEQNQALWNKYKTCMALATKYCEHKQPYLLITHGTTASGKSFLAKQLVPELGCIRTNSDRERKRQVGLEADAQTFSGVNEDFYQQDKTEDNYNHLHHVAGEILQAGYPAIVDATFIKARYRDKFAKLANQYSVPMWILHTYANPEILNYWLDHRSVQGNKESEAYRGVLEMQLQTLEPLTETETAYTIAIDMEQFKTVAPIVEQVQDKLARHQTKVAI